MTAPERDDLLEQARVHVLRLQHLQPNVSNEAWARSIANWLEPLAATRAWRCLARRRSTPPVAVLVPPVTHSLAPPAGTRPQPRCSLACFLTHAGDLEASG